MKEFEKERMVSIVYTMNGMSITRQKATIATLIRQMDIDVQPLRKSLNNLRSIKLVVTQGMARGTYYALTSKALELIDKDQVKSYIDLNVKSKTSAPKLTKIIPASAAKLRTAIASINAVLPEIEAMLDKSSESTKLIERVKYLQGVIKSKDETIIRLETDNKNLTTELSTYKKKLHSIRDLSNINLQ